MLPILASLIQAGLPILAGAFASKGKEVIESKLGINLDNALGTETGRLELKKLEFAHEEFLLAQAQQGEARGFDYFKEEIADKASARAREIALEAARESPWWAPSTVTILTFCIIFGCGYLFVVIPETEVRYAIIAIVTSVLNYYYGTTRTSAIKDVTISKQAENSK